MKTPRLEIVFRAQADADYTIAYIDDDPAVIAERGDGGFWSFIGLGQYIENPGQRMCWHVDDKGEWHGISDSRIEDSYILYQITAGDRKVYSGPLEKAFRVQ